MDEKPRDGSAALDAGMMPFSKPTVEDSRKISAPALRTFYSIAEEWALSEQQCIALLAAPSRSTYDAWMRKSLDNQEIALPADTLLRISAILGIYKNLTAMFETPDRAVSWLTRTHPETIFADKFPLNVMVHEDEAGLFDVRQYLDGLYAQWFGN
ncbi:MAG: MbcA/ParS/Xre antitoxin family protein [Pseudomonadota bacterium]